MASVHRFEAHARPPESMRKLFKKYQKCTLEDLDHDHEILCSSSENRTNNSHMTLAACLDANVLQQCWDEFLKCSDGVSVSPSTKLITGCADVYEVKALPGLFVVPSLLPPHVQIEMLNRLLHRDLSLPSHKTNLHLHYDIPYSEDEKQSTSSQRNDSVLSFFSMSPLTRFAAKDPAIHKDIAMDEVLEKKLRWMTLGGQYDWTAKRYPIGPPPPFPVDIGRLLQRLFPNIEPQAAILNLYTPGDTLSVHRDVSELCDRDLISISIGCEAIFIVGNADGSRSATLRLKSGDAVCMTGSSRFAWHAVPKVMPKTCPEWLQAWPATNLGPSAFNEWRDWMSNKRINLNVRQMTASSKSSSEQVRLKATLIQDRQEVTPHPHH